MATETSRAGRARHAITIPNPDRPLKRNEKGEITDAGERKTYQYGEVVSLTADQAKDPIIRSALMSESENAAYEAQLAAKGIPLDEEDDRDDLPGLTGERVDSKTGQRVDDAGAPGGATGGTNPDGSAGKTGSAGSNQGNTSTALTGGSAADQGKTGQSADNAKTKADGSPF